MNDKPEPSAEESLGDTIGSGIFLLCILAAFFLGAGLP